RWVTFTSAQWVSFTSALTRKALALDASDRTELVGLLIDSLDPETEQGAEAAWLREIDRRARELDSGTVQTIPWEIARERLLRAPRD
ncbi:MAG TPA: addiction module protein, partial [Burkholderiales bacterium]|nr:addiction module protein [Burkholderiales bacterium]